MSHSLGDTTHRGVRQWYSDKGFTGEIQKKLKDSFASMFPDYKDAFDYRWNADRSIEALNGIKVVITGDANVLFGRWKIFFKSMTSVFSEQERRNAYESFCAREQEIKTGTNGYLNMYMNDISDSTARQIIDELLEHHRNQLRDYVEKITPYFTMTVKR